VRRALARPGAQKNLKIALPLEAKKSPAEAGLPIAAGLRGECRDRRRATTAR
jgi:hypothetical protein